MAGERIWEVRERMTYVRILTEFLINRDSCHVHPLIVVCIHNLENNSAIPEYPTPNEARMHLT